MNIIELQRIFNTAEAANKQGNYSEAEALCSDVLQQFPTLDDSRDNSHRILLAQFSRLLADILMRQRKIMEALPYAEQSLAIGIACNDKDIQARSHGIIGIIYGDRADFPKAMDCFHQALKLNEDIGRKEGVSITLCNIGLVYQMLSDYPRSLEYLYKALVMDEELGLQEGIARNLGNIGIVHAYLSEYPQALENFQKALEMNEKLGLKKAIGLNLSNIGNVYQVLSDFPRALECFQQALAINEELGQKEGIAFALGNVGVIEHALSRHESALEYYQKALAMNEEIDNKYLITINLANIGSIYEYYEQHSQALELYERTLAMNIELGIELGIAINYGNLGDIYSKSDMEVRNPVKAEEYLLKAIEILRRIGSKKEYYEFLLSLSNLYASLNRWEEAYEFHRQFYEIKEEIQNESISIQTQRVAIERDMSVIKREQEILHIKNAELAEINAKLEHTNVELYLLNSSLEAALEEIRVVQTELIRSERAASLANIELSQKNEALHQLNIEKNEFLEIASHDLKNPLSSIMMLANSIEDEAPILTILEIQEHAGEIRVTSKRMFDLIVNLLDVNKIEHGILLAHKEVFSVGQCTLNVIHHHQSTASKKNIRLNVQTDDTHIETSPTAFIQVLDNLISNAIKFSPLGSEIQIRTDRTPSNHLRLCVKDQGPGLTSEDQSKLFGKFMRLSAQPTGGEHSTGLGLSIVKKLVEAMNGRIWCESEIGKGAEFIVEFPVYIPEKMCVEIGDNYN